MSLRFSLKPILLASALGGLVATSASAQDYGSGDPRYSNDATERVYVQRPRIRINPGRLTGAPARLSLSQAVSYDDLDLTTREGARELRIRVGDTARDVCDQLRDAYPVYQQPGTSCFRDAYRNGMIRAGEAIYDARYSDEYR